MASAWWIFGRNSTSSEASSSKPSATEFLQLSKTNIDEIVSLTSIQPYREPLNAYQCQSMSFKLVKILKNIETLASVSRALVYPNGDLTTAAFENFFRVSQRAREIVEDCCSLDWCLASAFQIHNEEAFKEILLDTSLCYNVIFDLANDILNKDHVSFEDLRITSAFDPPTSTEVLQDQMALITRYTNFVNDSNVSSSFIRKHLAKYLLKRLNCNSSKSNMNSKDFDVCNLNLWQDGKSPDDEWGKESEVLGVGASGGVCKRTWLDVTCAQKVIQDCTPEDGILLEARILASLNHPNIVKFLCCGHDHKFSRHFIAMQHMEAGLHSVIKKRARLKNGSPFILLSAIDIMLQIASGTCYLHENGIAHRDMKPSNVVVNQITTLHLQEYFQVKLVDFGLSKVNLKVSKSNTISKPNRGTTIYRPPEVFYSGKANWFKADAYRFGIMCSEILSGNEPFETIARSKIYKLICNGERPKLPQDIPEDLVLLIKTCWDTDQHSRPKFVEICTRLAIIKHRLLQGELIGDKYKYNNVNSSNWYIHKKILISKYKSDARAYDYFQSNHSKGEGHLSKSVQVTKATTVYQVQEEDKSNVMLYRSLTPPKEQQHRPITPSRQSQQHRPITPSRQSQQHRPITPSRQLQQHRPITLLSQSSKHQTLIPTRQSSQHPKFRPIAIFWDIDNCQVPQEMKVENVAQNIRIALRDDLRFGVVNTYRAYDNFNHFPQTFREECQRLGIDLIDVPNGKKNAVHNAIWVDMALFAIDNPPPSTIFLITRDVGFSNALHKLSQRGYDVVIVIPKELGVISSLKSASSFVFDWSCLCRGEGLQKI